MVTVAVELVDDRGLRLTLAGPTLGDVHGAGALVGPQAANVKTPVGAPRAAVPVTVAVSVAVDP
jgi:hypothetical protein